MRTRAPKSNRRTLLPIALLITAAAIGFLAGTGYRAAIGGAGEPATDHPANQNSALPARQLPGPTRQEHGAPAGFAHDRDGAIAAAAAYVCTASALLGVDPMSAEDAVRQMTSRAFADGDVKQTRAQLSALRDRLT